MLNAPAGAVFVWCNSALAYPKALAQSVGRGDLLVRPLSWLEPHNVRGCRFAGVIVDHAARLDDNGFEALDYVRSHEASADG